MIWPDPVGCLLCVLTAPVSFIRDLVSSFFAIKLDIMVSVPALLLGGKRLKIQGNHHKRPVEVGCITLRHLGCDSRDCVQTLRTSAEQLSCSLRLLGFFPMHSDSQPFVRVAIWGETFTAITRVQIPSGTPIKSITYLSKTSPKIKMSNYVSNKRGAGVSFDPFAALAYGAEGLPRPPTPQIRAWKMCGLPAPSCRGFNRKFGHAPITS